MVERFLGIVVQPLLVRRAICFGHDLLGFICFETQLKYLYKDLWLTDILTILPHGVEDVKKDVDEFLSMRFLYST